MFRLVVTALFVGHAAALNLRLPSDVGDGKGIKHPCVQVMKETQGACSGLKHGSSNDDCNFAFCYTADLNRKRCSDIVTDGAPTNVKFPKDLDKLVKNHDIKCDGGKQSGDGIRNARFDCKNVAKSGMWDGKKLFLLEFAKKYPASMESSGIQSCL